MPIQSSYLKRKWREFAELGSKSVDLAPAITEMMGLNAGIYPDIQSATEKMGKLRDEVVIDTHPSKSRDV